jgi:hypothetical protein
MTPIFGIAGADEATALPAVLGIFGGLLLVIISFLFLDNKFDYSSASSVNFRSDYMPQNLSGANAPQNALPPQQSVPVSSYIPPAPGKWQTTNDLSAPSSVTEPTTKLLEKDK